MDREELIRAMSDSDATQLAVRMIAVENAKQALMEKNTPANVAALERAERSVDKLLNRSNQAPEAAGGFATGLAVLDYLHSQNRKIAKTKLYMDLKSIPRRDGRWPRAAIDRYAASLPWASAPATEQARGEDLSALGLAKARLEVDKLREDHRRLSMQNDKLAGKLVDRREAELDRADSLLALYTEFVQAVEEGARELAEAAGGDPALAPELADRLKALLDAACNRLSRAGAATLEAGEVLAAEEPGA